MVIWAAIWGAVLGVLWPRTEWDWGLSIGAILGALAGLSFRRAVRQEIDARLAGRAVPATAAQPAAQAPAQGTTAAAATAAPTATVAPAASRSDDADPTIPLAATTATLPAAAPAAPPPPSVPAAPARPSLVDALLQRARDWLFGGNTVVRMGVLVLFVGLAFLAKYAVENALLPPELRLAAIGAAGIALFVAGLRLRGRAPGKLGYALTLQGAGIAVLYLTVFAAFRLYQFLPAGAAFAALGLICAFSAVIAVAQSAQALAFIGFAGAYAAPLLVSTGQGNHVALFGYYTVLGVAIASIAIVRAWRPLNLLGFFATFLVATAWGVLKYQPEQYASTQPFLIGFFLIYLTASLLYALRHALAARRAVDATLVFGTPIVAFGLQAALVREIEYAAAFSALVLGALYLALGWWLVRRRAGDATVQRWLAECFLALGLGFATLAVPLALDGRWTSAVWAIEGAGVFWMGRRQARWLPRAAGLALQGLAAVLYLDAATSSFAPGTWPVANPMFVGAAMLSAAALAIAWWSREPAAPQDDSRIAARFAPIELALSPVLLWVGFLWAIYGVHGEIDRGTVDANGVPGYLLSEAARAHLKLLAWAGAAFALHPLALPARARPWPVAATPAWTLMPLMLVSALWGMSSMNHVFQAGGWITWPLVIAMHLLMLRRLDAGRPAAWWPWVHAGGVWLMVLLAGNALAYAIGKAQLWQTAWATVILLVAGSGVLLVLAWGANGAERARGWPLDRFARDYQWRAAAPLALALAAAALLVAVHSNGEARPLPYVPLLNPTDLAVALAVGVCALWLLRLRGSALALPAFARGPAPPAVLAALAFVAINTVWLRVAHHFAGVPWDAHSLFASFLVQAGYSILWTLIALVLMVAAHRRALRLPWMLGAGLLGVTVLKLFVIDLSNRGGSERIFVFIAVGLLMLVVGWFAPLPPARRDTPDNALQEAAP